jgi:SRSO17 transposase
MPMERRRYHREAQDLLRACEMVPRDLEACLDRLKDFTEPFVRLLPRSQLHGHAQSFIRGLVSDLERKSTEPIAEREGRQCHALQRFIGWSPWAHEPLLDELCKQVAREIGEPNGVLVLDPSTFPKKGDASVGVARQWCGRLGKVDNCQSGVFLGYVSNKGHTLVDERLYLPKAWAKDKARRAMCHVPRKVPFKTVHQLSVEMLQSRGPSLPHRWVTGDDEFGRVPWFRARLREMKEPYVLEIPGSLLVCAAEDPPKTGGLGKPRKAPFMRASKWKDLVPRAGWERIHIRDGTKGPLVVLAACAPVRTRSKAKRQEAIEWLIVTKTESETPEVRYYLAWAEGPVVLEEAVHAANARHWIEDCFERAKGRVGLDHYEIRSWIGWHHHMTLCLLALWFLVLEQNRLSGKTPAITVQQTAEAIGEILRHPTIDVRRLARRITSRLTRIEQSRIDHWKKCRRLPPPWDQVRSCHVSQ